MQKHSRICERNPQQGFLFEQANMTEGLMRRCQACFKIWTIQLTICDPDALKLQIKQGWMLIDIIGDIYHKV